MFLSGTFGLNIQEFIVIGVIPLIIGWGNLLDKKKIGTWQQNAPINEKC